MESKKETNQHTRYNPTSAVNFEACRKRLKLYFSDLEKVKQKIIAGEIINLPYVTLQKDRRIKKEKCFKNERRSLKGVF